MTEIRKFKIDITNIPEDEIGEYLQSVFDNFENYIVNEPEVEFVNDSGLEFKDISAELYREYRFPNGNKLLIKKPLYLHVSASGGHRLFDAQSTAWYVQPAEGWSINWKVGEGKSNFLL